MPKEIKCPPVTVNPGFGGSKTLFSPLLYVFLLCFLGGCQSSEGNSGATDTITQPELGYRSAKVLEVDGFQFKDLNKDGELNPYEDWRLTAVDRAADLLSKMSLEQKAGFMIISSTRMENDWSFQRPETNDPIASGFNEKDLVRDVNMFTRKPLPFPNMLMAGTTKDVTQFHKRHFILRANPPAKVIAEWANNLQALCESDGLGIPAIITSNPRNHITIDAALGLGLGKTAFSQWPGELGLAAMRDFAAVREFADIARQEWLSVGLRKGYMYMADLATEPRWQRTEGTFGEDADLAAKVTREIVLGFQGEELSSTSIALTTKHFPGGGSAEDGQDPHFDWGKREVFEAGMFDNNLIPFKAAIDAGTSSIMPYYSYPVNTKYPELGYAFNKEVLQGLLRGELGFKGIINSDTGPIDMMPWGVEELSVQQRYKLAIEAGINIFSGTADPTQLIETLKKHPELMPMVDNSVQLLLEEKFRLGLFENPYVNPESASETAGKQGFQDRADIAMRKSIVLLRNENVEDKAILPLVASTKVYFEILSDSPAEEGPRIYQSEQSSGQIELVDTPDQADVVLLWLIPKGQSLFQSDGSAIHVNLSSNKINTDYVNTLTKEKNTILVVNYTNPWAIDEVYNNTTTNIKSILATFGTTPEAILDIVTGQFKPKGKMPFSTPASDAQAQSQKSDLPGYQEGEDYALFHFDEGMTFEEQ